MEDEIKTYDIPAVEIFSAGEWNKDKYTTEDLHNMVSAFNSLKDGFKPYLKLGHDEKQTLLKSSGLPAIGWVENIYVKGTKLFADLQNIPKEIYKLIKAKAYRKVSCEVYWDLEVAGNKYPRVLGALALLGAETPGVLNLADILGRYTLIDQNKSGGVFEALGKQDSFKSYATSFVTNMEDDQMSEELKKVQDELDEQKKSYAKSLEDLEAKQKEMEAQVKELETLRAEKVKAELEAQVAKVSKFVTELEAKKLSTPAMKELITQLMSDKKEFSLKDKPATKEEIVTEILTLSSEAAKVNFKEGSKAEYAKKEDKEKALEEKISKYAADNKCTYAQAYKAVMKSEKKEDKSEE